MRIKNQEYAKIVERHISYPDNVCLKKLAQELGTDIYSTDLPEGVSGILLKDEKYSTPSEFICLISNRLSKEKQRFVAAHELGHFVLHQEVIGNRHEDNFLLKADIPYDEKKKKLEDEANKFAYYILLPFDKIIKKSNEEPQTIKELAKTFQVTETAMAIRLGSPT